RGGSDGWPGLNGVQPRRCVCVRAMQSIDAIHPGHRRALPRPPAGFLPTVHCPPSTTPDSLWPFAPRSRYDGKVPHNRGGRPMLGVKLGVRPFLDRVAEEVGRVEGREVQALADAIYCCYEADRFVFIIGNGGSGSNSSHFCEDLGKATLRREDFDDEHKKRLRVLSLTDNTPYILAWGNDEGFERIFVEQLKNLAGSGDLLIAISGSGNSPNVLRAVEWANRH